uniref:Uncharacterized protein n=1 Tax=Nelumbo nucifera TaxID=4432 RepID=A0A822Z1T9_NELNU|nr:TPA_asm: hypothetical protein HUJ06_013059 [Nelumbo nucifera]
MQKTSHNHATILLIQRSPSLSNNLRWIFFFLKQPPRLRFSHLTSLFIHHRKKEKTRFEYICQ